MNSYHSNLLFPAFLWRCIGFLARYVLGWKRHADTVNATGLKTVTTLPSCRAALEHTLSGR